MKAIEIGFNVNVFANDISIGTARTLGGLKRFLGTAAKERASRVYLKGEVLGDWIDGAFSIQDARAEFCSPAAMPVFQI
jgi:hypothetical protein